MTDWKKFWEWRRGLAKEKVERARKWLQITGEPEMKVIIDGKVWMVKNPELEEKS